MHGVGANLPHVEPLVIAFRGNFKPAYSTENDIARSLESLGHRVYRIQEDEVPWSATLLAARGADVFLWTSTYSFAQRWDRSEASAAVGVLNRQMPTVAIHLDRFCGLARQGQLDTEPWFRLQTVFTADGAHQDVFASKGINHHYLPPAVLADSCYRGSLRDEFACDVAFVGSWQGYGHTEWSYRSELIAFLRDRYGDRLGLWPKVGQEAVRGNDLNDLYASAKVVVGDSCLAPKVDGSPMTHYVSDRLFETAGRVACIIHPHVEGIFPELLVPGEHCITYELGDFEALAHAIDWCIADPERTDDIADAAFAHVVAHHTYAHRVQEVLSIVTGEEMAA